jgi:cytochrome c-type biogenesis protein CcmE
VDLSPRTLSDIEAPSAPPQRKRPWAAMIVLALVLIAGTVAVTKFLSSAIDYYCNVNEIGTKSGCTIGRELRIQGTVDEGSIRRDGDVTLFSISFGGATIPVHYAGGQADLFQACIPVVIHGKVVNVNGNREFDGTEIEVKHSATYTAAHPDRLDPATGKVESAACSQTSA